MWLRCAAACVFALALSSCGDDNDAPPPTQTSDKVYAIFSAFPAEMALLVERATVKEERTIKNQFGRDLIFRRGELGGVQVVIALTGIGLVNAAEATNILLDNFDVAGIIFSGVAGSPLPLGSATSQSPRAGSSTKARAIRSIPICSPSRSKSRPKT